MKKNILVYTLLFCSVLFSGTVFAKRPTPQPEYETATFEDADVTYEIISSEGLINYGLFTGIDYPTGLKAEAQATQDARGQWNVEANAIDHLVVNNNNVQPGGVMFSLPWKKRGSTVKFDLVRLKLFGTLFGAQAGLAGKELHYSILAYYTNTSDEVPVAIPFSIFSLAAPTIKDFSNDTRLKCLDHAIVQFAPEVGKTYFIETNFSQTNRDSTDCQFVQ